MKRLPGRKIITSILVISLLTALIVFKLPAVPGTADSAELKWSRVNIPTQGQAGDWMLAAGSDIGHLTVASDGTFLTYANPTGDNSTLFKSTDSGVTWQSVELSLIHI